MESWFDRKDAGVLVAIAAIWAVFYALIGVGGDFPLNDDFQYAESARLLASGGGLRLSEWSLSPALPQILFGSLIGGGGVPSNGALRLSVLILGLAAVQLTYLTLRGAGLSLKASALAAALIGTHPIYLSVSASFLKEVPFYFFEVAALAALLYARRSKGWTALAVCSLCCLGAYLTRQPGALFILGAAVALYSEGRRDRIGYAALAIPAAIGAAVFIVWMRFSHGEVWASKVLVPTLSFIFEPSAWGRGMLRTNAYIQTAALFMLPLSAAIAKGVWNLRRPRGKESFILIGLVFLWGAGVFLEGGMPLVGNTLHTRGLGVLTIDAGHLKPAGIWSSFWTWRLLDLVSLLSSIVLVRGLYAAWPARPAWARTALLFSAPALLFMLVMADRFDRYLLTGLAGVVVCITGTLAQKRIDVRAAAFAAAAPLLAVGIGMRDYFQWNRARWEAGMHGVSLGVPHERISNGFDWDGQFTMAENMRTLLSEKPAQQIGMWDWGSLNSVLLVTSFSDEPPRKDFVRVSQHRYTTPLALKGGAVYLYRHDPYAAAGTDK